MIVIGLGHRMGVGKDAAAVVLTRRYGFVRRAFADALKEEVIDLFPTLLDEVCKVTPGAIMCADPAENRRRLVWELKPPLVRALLQHHGTDVRRRDTAGQYWVRRLEDWLAENQPDRVVVTDVRFLNEVEWVKHGYPFGAGPSFVVRVDRRSAPRTPASDHASETEAESAQWDYVLNNHDDGLDALERNVDYLMNAIGVSPVA